jgi:L-amino acid N-acyltransferase YncA
VTAAVRPGRAGDAATVAALHAARIGEGFLTSLGPRFLTRLYRRIALASGSVLVVAEADGTVVGFVAATTSTRRLYAEFLRRDAVPAALAAAPAVLRAPRRVWETLRYGAGRDGLPAAEVLSIAVAEGATGGGVGGLLLVAALDALAALGATEAQVVTAVENQAALTMYERAGFRRWGRTEVHPGVVQEVLVWP